MKEIVTTKTVKEVKEIKNNFYIKKIILQPYEAEMLLKKKVAIYEETIDFNNGCCRKVYYCFIDMDALASIAQKQTGEV